MKEKDEQIQLLTSKFSDICDKLNALMEQKEEERRRRRDYELETDFIDKDQKFDILTFTSEATEKKRHE